MDIQPLEHINNEFVRINKILNESNTHLNQSIQDEMKDFFTKYMIIVIHGCFELELKRIIFFRVEKTNDAEVHSFIKNWIEGSKHFPIKVESLKTYLKDFDPKYPNLFDKQTTTEEKDLYTTFTNNRNLFAHGCAINVTYKELVDNYPKMLRVIKKFSAVLQSSHPLQHGKGDRR